MEVVQQRDGGEPVVVEADAQADGRVERFAREVHQPVGLGHPDRQFGVARMEPRQPRDQPLHGQRADAGDVHLAFGRGAHLAEGRLQLVEGVAQRAGYPVAGVGEFQRVARPLGELDAAHRLQAAHLAADRAVGDAKLVGGEAHLAQARERLEGAKGGERQLATLGHVTSAHKQLAGYSGLTLAAANDISVRSL